MKSANSEKRARRSCSRSGSVAGGAAAGFFSALLLPAATVLFEAGGGPFAGAFDAIAAESRAVSAPMDGGFRRDC